MNGVYIKFLGEKDTLSRDNNSQNSFCLPSEKGSTLKGKNLLGTNSFL